MDNFERSPLDQSEIEYIETDEHLVDQTRQVKKQRVSLLAFQLHERRALQTGTDPYNLKATSQETSEIDAGELANRDYQLAEQLIAYGNPELLKQIEEDVLLLRRKLLKED